MAINQITINFEDCEPIGGYYVFYRPIGSVDPYRFAGIFFANPIVFTDENDPINQEYEGYMQSHCGGGVFGDIIPWESSGSVSGSGSQPGSEPGEDECCDPIVLTADVETTIPDESGSASGSEAETCCTPVILSACIETIPDESGSGSGGSSGGSSGSSSGPPMDTDGIMMLFSAEAYAILSLEDLTYWNTRFDVFGDGNADTPFDEILLYPDDLKIVLKGCTNLALVNVFQASTEIKGFWDNSGTLTHPSGTGNSFYQAVNLEVVEMNYTETFGANTFGESGLISLTALAGLSFSNGCFRLCFRLETVNIPSAITMSSQCFGQISGPGTISIITPSLAPYGATAGDDNIFLSTSGQTIEITLPTSEEFDGDIVAVQATNSVTLILV